jgi:hypothetical protein
MARPEVFHDLHHKMARAERHLSDLPSVIRDFRGTAEYPIRRHDDVLHNRHVIRMYSPPAPYDLPLILGDCIYNLRSALDHLAWQLSYLTIPVPPTEVQFPIHASADARTEKRFENRVRGMPLDAVKEIRRLQPYHRAAYRDDPLWKLNALSNIDKHRMFAVNSNTANVFVVPGGVKLHRGDRYCEFTWPLSVKAQVVFEPLVVSFVFGTPMDLPGDPVEVEEQDIAEIYRYIRVDVLPSFERFFA